MQYMLLIPTLAMLIASQGFLYVAIKTAAKTPTTTMKSAHSGFVLWWSGLAIFAAVEAVEYGLVAMGFGTPIAVLLAMAISEGALIAAGSGLAYFVLILYLKQKWIMVPIGIYSTSVAILWGIATGQVFASGQELLVTSWTVNLSPVAGQVQLLTLLSVLPGLFVLGLAAFGLGIQDRTQRYRLTLSSFAVAAWLCSVAVRHGAFGVQYGAIAFAASFASPLLIFFVYYPPNVKMGWLRRQAWFLPAGGRRQQNLPTHRPWSDDASLQSRK